MSPTSRRRRVISMSSRLGVGSPEGWLWTKMTAAAASRMMRWELLHGNGAESVVSEIGRVDSSEATHAAVASSAQTVRWGESRTAAKLAQMMAASRRADLRGRGGHRRTMSSEDASRTLAGNSS